MDKALEDFLNDISVKIMQLFEDSSGRQWLIVLLGFNLLFFVGKLIAFDGRYHTTGCQSNIGFIMLASVMQATDMMNQAVLVNHYLNFNPMRVFVAAVSLVVFTFTYRQSRRIIQQDERIRLCPSHEIGFLWPSKFDEISCVSLHD